MKRICFILFLFTCVTSYSQTFWSPVWMKSTVKMTGISGTGTLLGIDGLGNVSKVTGIGAAGVTGLTPYELLIGDVTGIINQTPNLQWSDAFLSDILYISGTNPLIDIRDPLNSLVANYTNASMFLSDGTGAAMDIEYNMIKFIDDDNGSVSIFKKDDNSGTAYNLYLPPVNGTSGKSLRLNGSLELEWFTPGTGTVTSFSATDGNGFDFTVTNPTTTPTLALTTTIGDNQIMYSNGGALGGTSLFTYDNTTNNEQFDVTVLDFDVVGTSSYPFSLFNISDNGNVSICDFNGNVNGTYAIFDDPSESIILSANNGITVNQFSALGENLVYSNNSGTLGLATLSDFTLSGGALSITSGAIVNADINASAAIDATKINTGVVSNTEFNYLDGATSSIQTQLDSKTVKVGTAVNLTGQNAAIGITTIYTTPATDGFYQVNWVASITTAGTTSTLGPFKISFTNASDNIVKTYPTSAVNFYNQTNANTTGASIGGSFTVYCKASTDIRYIMGRTSTGTAMVYDLNIQIVKL